MSRIQARAAELEWQHFRDDERYHPLRDGPRQYRAVWVLDTMRRYLPPDQVVLMSNLEALARELEAAMGGGAFDRVDCSPRDSAAAQEQRVAKMQRLTGFERAAAYRVGPDGRLCFLGIVGGDSQAELARRVGYAPDSQRSLRKLVQITLEALSAYDAENFSAAC